MERGYSLKRDDWRSFAKRTNNGSEGATSALSALSSNDRRPKGSNKAKQRRGILMDTISRAHDFDIFDRAGAVARSISRHYGDRLLEAPPNPIYANMIACMKYLARIDSKYPKLAEYMACHDACFADESFLEKRMHAIKLAHGRPWAD